MGSSMKSYAHEFLHMFSQNNINLQKITSCVSLLFVTGLFSLFPKLCVEIVD
jgi:hypothetical protein